MLDSLLQEVCIESGLDGSLTLSFLGLSVCLVSHNLLYSGLKKAHLKKGSFNIMIIFVFCQRDAVPMVCLVIWELPLAKQIKTDLKDIFVKFWQLATIQL